MDGRTGGVRAGGSHAARSPRRVHALLLPSFCPASARVGRVGTGVHNVQVGADWWGVVYGAEVRRTSTGRRAVTTSTSGVHHSLVCGR